ncbi:hypothetical protein KIN20_006650 [Parelaphostrongylus tenuis]|uniref:PWWP domain-containing protein n=1 Tax=Parelaphostrongylus tenuis TaxID=148309 RepID=A0AAD5QH14_PARTN|nr:hypothetical protein KIN20_006650 [Parelaphostrongylus tenuis]
MEKVSSFVYGNSTSAMATMSPSSGAHDQTLEVITLPPTTPTRGYLRSTTTPPRTPTPTREYSEGFSSAPSSVGSLIDRQLPRHADHSGFVFSEPTWGMSIEWSSPAKNACNGTEGHKSRRNSNERPSCGETAVTIDESELGTNSKSVSPSLLSKLNSLCETPNEYTSNPEESVSVEINLVKPVTESDVTCTWPANMGNDSTLHGDAAVDSNQTMVAYRTWEKEQRRGDPVKSIPYVVCKGIPVNVNLSVANDKQLESGRMSPWPLCSSRRRSYSHPPSCRFSPYPTPVRPAKWPLCEVDVKPSFRYSTGNDVLALSSIVKVSTPIKTRDERDDQVVTVADSDVAAECIMEIPTDAVTVGQNATYSQTEPSNASPSTTEVAVCGEPMLKRNSPIATRTRRQTLLRELRPRAGRRTGERITSNDQVFSGEQSSLKMCKVEVNDHLQIGDDSVLGPKLNATERRKSQMPETVGDQTEEDGGNSSDWNVRSRSETSRQFRENRGGSSSKRALSYRCFSSDEYMKMRTCPFLDKPRSGELPQFVRYPQRSPQEVQLVMRRKKAFAKSRGDVMVPITAPVKKPNARNWKELLVGDVVWCKSRSSGYWPATVYKIGDAAPFEVTVRWINYATHSTVAYSDVDTFDMAYHLRFDSRRSDQNYLKAVAAALRYAGKVGFWEKFLTEKLYDEIVKQTSEEFYSHIGRKEIAELSKGPRKSQRQTKKSLKEEKASQRRSEELLQALQASHFINEYDDTPRVANALLLTQRVIDDFHASAHYASRNLDPLFEGGEIPQFEPKLQLEVDPQVLVPYEIIHYDENGFTYQGSRAREAISNGVSDSSKKSRKKKKSRRSSIERPSCGEIAVTIDESKLGTNSKSVSPSLLSKLNSLSETPNEDTSNPEESVSVEINLVKPLTESDVTCTWPANMGNDSTLHGDAAVDSNQTMVAYRTWEKEQRRGDPVKSIPYVVCKGIPVNVNLSVANDKQLESGRMSPWPLCSSRRRSYSHPPSCRFSPYPTPVRPAKWPLCEVDVKPSFRYSTGNDVLALSSIVKVSTPIKTRDERDDQMVTVADSDVAAECIMEIPTDAVTVGQNATYSQTEPSNASPSTTEVAVCGEPMLKRNSPIATRTRRQTLLRELRPRAGRRTRRTDHL